MPGEKRKKFGIALGSGGARGIAHLGFLEVLRERGIEIDCVCGASMGAIVGALFCMEIPMDRILERLNTLKTMQIVSFDPLFYKNCGMLKQTKALTILRSLLGNATFSDTKIPFCCSALDLKSGHTVCLKEGELAESVMASSSIPGVFQPMKIGDWLCVDGGIVNKVPVQMCRAMGAEIVLGVDVLGEIETREAPKNLIDTIERAFLIMNYYTGQTERHEADRLIVLEQPEIDPGKVEKLKRSYEIGRETAVDHLDEIRALVASETE